MLFQVLRLQKVIVPALPLKMTKVLGLVVRYVDNLGEISKYYPLSDLLYHPVLTSVSPQVKYF